jgi:hypothetical protein
MAVAVVVPCRLDDEHREAAWQWVSNRYADHHPDWQVVTGAGPDGPWVKALAVAEALGKTDADLIVLADADCWTEGLSWAVQKLAEWPWVIPHHYVHRLTQEATHAVLNGAPLGGATAQHPYKGYAGGGFMALRRDVYEQVPLDPRFVGWGQEDSAWHLALQKVAGQGIRGTADCWHLYHPPQPRMSRQYGSEASQALLDRYATARSADAMKALLAEVTDDRSHRAQPAGGQGASAVA